MIEAKFDVKDIDGNELNNGDVVDVLPKKFVTHGFRGTITATMTGVYVLGEVADGELSEDWVMLENSEVRLVKDLECPFDIAWVGKCGKTVKHGKFCEYHSTLKCRVCGEQATKTCGKTSQFVCGMPLCDKCKCKCGL